MKHLFLALLFASPLLAHRLDEYLQAALIGLDARQTTVELRLTPGVQVFPLVAALIDSDGDGRFSIPEQEAYAHRVAADWQFLLDQKPAHFQVQRVHFAAVEELAQGIASIEIHLAAPPAHSELLLRNRHQAAISVYLMNALKAPAGTKILAQHRDVRQSEIRIAFSRSSPEQSSALWLLLLAILARCLWLLRPKTNTSAQTESVAALLRS